MCLQMPTFVRVGAEALQRLVVHVERKDKQSMATRTLKRDLCDVYGSLTLWGRMYNDKLGKRKSF